ncbi:hypothetical protein [Amycolatopsis sp. NPDC001319]|uniref:hypothetical protein n=1 Tax=unclassified Amycolatopsis TaxID=2618356 RepID=UPI00369F04D7
MTTAWTGAAIAHNARAGARSNRTVVVQRTREPTSTVLRTVSRLDGASSTTRPGSELATVQPSTRPGPGRVRRPRHRQPTRRNARSGAGASSQAARAHCSAVRSSPAGRAMSTVDV